MKKLKKMNLTQTQVTASELDVIEATLSTVAIFSREAGAIIDIAEAKEQVEDLDTILPAATPIELLNENEIDYLEIYL
jgi:hypothetical protein